MSLAPVVLRDVVFVAFLAASVVAFGSWAGRTRAISPFGFLARAIRRVGGPVIDPIEHWQLKRGGNPQNAPWWLLGGVLVGGIVLVSGSQWLAQQIERASFAARFGPRGLLALALHYAFQIVILALIVRVVGFEYRAKRDDPAWKRRWSSCRSQASASGSPGARRRIGSRCWSAPKRRSRVGVACPFAQRAGATGRQGAATGAEWATVGTVWCHAGGPTRAN